MPQRPFLVNLPMVSEQPLIPPPEFDLLRVPVLRPLLRGKYGRAFLQVPMLLLALAMVWHGLTGPQLAPKNLATTLGRVHYRGFLALGLLAIGNVFCLGCPFMLVRQATRKIISPRFTWPRKLRNKWLSLALFALILYCYELFALWSSPWLTAWLIVAYFVGAVVVDSLFKHATFCKYVCPIGQFNFVSSAISPIEVGVRDLGVCASCQTKDCIRGTRASDNAKKTTQNGCELALYQPKKVGNMDCTFCLDCVHACPHENIGLLVRPWGSELVADPIRSGIGRYSHRFDLAALVILFTFGALVNALGMITPVYSFETWLADTLNLHSAAAVPGLLFVAVTITAPAILVGSACRLTRAMLHSPRPLTQIAGRYVHCLIPLGFSIWLSHYGYHLMTGFWTFVPVLQSAFNDWGMSFLGKPRWDMGGLSPATVHPLELMALGFGLLGSLSVAYRIAESDAPLQKTPVFIPWAVLCTLLWGAAVWLLSQPMDMRGTFLGSGN